MATDFDKLVVQLSADLRGYQNAMRQAVGITNTRAREIESRYRKMNATISRSFTAPLAGIGAALSTREIIRYADAWTNAGNMIASSAQAAGVQTRSLEQLRKGADDARTSLETYVNLYSRLIRSASGVAKSEEEIALATSLVSKAMKAGGAAVSEQQAAILQLGQALGSGVLQGDELRSLRENAPIVAQAIADEFGTTIAGLKDLGQEGKLTSERVFRAIINAQSGIEAQFAKTNLSISDGFVKLGNAVTEYVGKSAQAYGVTTAINSILAAVAGNMESVGAAAAAASVILMARYVPAVTRATVAGAVMVATNPFLALAAAIGAAAFALSAFGDDLRPVQGELATLQDYASVTWDAIRTGVEDLTGGVADFFLEMINWITDALGGLPVTWADVGDAIKGIVNKWIGIHVAAFETIKAVFTLLPAAVAEGIIGAVNRVIAKVEDMIRFVLRGVNKAIGALNMLPLVDLDYVDPTVHLGRVENSFRDAGAKLGAALKDGVSGALDKDYLGDAFGAVSDAANLRALDRMAAERDRRDSERPTSRAGFGGGGPGADGGGSKGKGAKGAKGAKERENEIQREIAQIKERTAALVAETEAQAGINPLIEDYGYAVAKAAATHDLLTAAQKAGVEVTPALLAQIEGLAEAYAQAEVASGQLAESQDDLVRRAGEIADLQKDATKGLIKDLVEGKSAADAFAGALGRIGDKLLDMAIDGAFPKGGFGAGGGLFGGRIIPGILHDGGIAGRDGYGHGRSVPPAIFANARRYHNGGIAGLMPGEVPAILQRGERVIPRGGSAGGGNMDVRVYVDDNGNWQAKVERIAGARVRAEAPRLVNQSVRAVQEGNAASARFLNG